MNLLEVFVLGEQIEGIREWCVRRNQVKGRNGLRARLDWVTNEIERLDFALETRQLHEWLDRLGRYRGRTRLTEKDALELVQVIHSWATLIGKDLYDRPVIEVNIQTLRPVDIAAGPRAFVQYVTWKHLSRLTKSGLSDATKCLAVGASTASAMACFRVAEDIVRRYFAVKTHSKPPNNWKELLGRLLKAPDVKASLLGHLDYLRDRRNEAEHPDRLFTQEQAERIFITVIDLLHEIYSEMPASRKHRAL